MTEPDDIDVEPTAVTITWDDGHVTRLGAEVLRASCPCAECRDLRERGGVPRAQGVTAAGAELVGAWGLNLLWSDGHHTGIYSWPLLRAWCECAQCEQANPSSQP